MSIESSAIVMNTFCCKVYSVKSDLELPNIFDIIDAEGNYHFKICKIALKVKVEDVELD